MKSKLGSSARPHGPLPGLRAPRGACLRRVLSGRPEHSRYGTRPAGMTVLEVTVAMLILGLSTATILQFVASADRVRGRAVQIAAATRAAQNEAERVRRVAGMLLPVSDTAYTDAGEGLEVEVRRTAIDDDEDGMPVAMLGAADTLRTVAVQIEVLTALQDSPLVTFRMLQGYER